ncbi:DNA mismatch repair protein MutS domain protein [Candidatus Methylobacter favarea]|uniref:DNA mismatch repair protein MutS domain protein n=1 Tax=Candidatus Methylobacter favarea TaxID=2707345 RepID=A0A8S0WN21_9GAMM|nr:DNA mismatch repair protein MutS [Candidatus Methylobacter favarea]CAA9890132.1 DNA mismatch repair protein MutS domain protein [Candidatus Methylobacter favarea]
MNETLLQSWNDAWPAVKCSKPLTTGAGVIDESTFNTIEVEKVFNTLNYASTLAGQAVLFRSLTQPLNSLEKIKAKQEALEELRTNLPLKENIEYLIENAAAQEKNFYLLLFGKFLGSFETAREEHEIEGYGYLQYKRGVRFMLELVARIKAAEAPQSAYLKSIFDKITAFADTRPYSLMEGPAYITENGIKCKQERKGLFPLAIIFRPRIFKPVLIILFFAMVWTLAHFFPTDIFAISVEAIPTAFIFFVPLLLIYFPIVGGFDRDSCIIPLRNEFKNSEAVAQALDALGQLDELVSFLKFAEAFAHSMVLPQLIDAAHHRIKLIDAKNPVLGKENTRYVGNDFVLEDEKLVFITGPNSGGKTAFCKTVTQIQLLAQIGCFVPAKSATLTVADKIFYQVPEISHLNDGEGRFGTELKRTKDIFLATTARSLVVLDELSEGTTFEEKMESSSNVLNGFYRKGNSTVLITHNHQLVDNFVNQGLGLSKQVEFANESPTYKLIDGISRVSHADRVAKKIGFSKEDIDSYLAGSE